MTGAAKSEMPQDARAEEAVLGAMLIDADCIDEAIEAGLSPGSFCRPSNAEVCAAVYALHEKGETADQLTLAAELERRGSLERCGGRARVVSLAEAAGYSPRGFAGHVRIVRMRARQRDVIGLAAAVSALGHDAPETEDELRDQLDSRWCSVMDSWDGCGTVWTAAEAAKRGWERGTALGGEEMGGLESGYRSLDAITGGLKAGQLAILAARPSMGKTALALNLAVNAAAGGAKVRFYSLEMGNEAIVDRVTCIMGRIDSRHFENNEALDASSAGRMKAAYDRLWGYDIEFDDNPSATCAYVRSSARRAFRHADPGRGLVVVDYLQLMRFSDGGRFESRQVEVAETSRALKRLAKEIRQPVLALSQLSRLIDTRADKRPVLSDLRESGAIEQDADIVMFLDRSRTPEEAMLDNRPDYGKADVIVAKHRNGKLGTARLGFQDSCMRFEEER